MQDKVADLRRDYDRGSLDEAAMAFDPVDQFAAWFEEAKHLGFYEPNAMALATATADGAPSLRTVLLKAFDHRGFVFYTNFESRKGMELATNPNAALLFWWDRLERQVRIEGKADLISDGESDSYFASRPRASQIGAWTSPQSQLIGSRETLEEREAELQTKFSGAVVPRPAFWGGVRVRPSSIEFWQGRRGRLHDRLRYLRTQDAWRLERLAP